MSKTFNKRFNAQRAARSELKMPEAEEGVHFITSKNDAGAFEYFLLEATAAAMDKLAATGWESCETDPDWTPTITAPAADEMPAFLDRTAGRSQADIDAERVANTAKRSREVGPAREIVMPKTKPAAPKVERSEGKSARLVAAASSKAGITNAEIRAMTGWTKLGGFFGAVKRAGLKLNRVRENGDTRWFAA